MNAATLLIVSRHFLHNKHWKSIYFSPGFTYNLTDDYLSPLYETEQDKEINRVIN